jgi:hypothetical protein
MGGIDAVLPYSNKVLILGNGISRLLYDDYIRNFPGPVWGCNYIYLDYGEIIDMVTGHQDVLVLADKYRKEKNLEYKIISGSALTGKNKYEDSFRCALMFLKDSGTSLVAEALTRKYKVEVCGFDIGGKDCYSPEHQKINKRNWVERWRIIFRSFGHENIKFIGYDHKKYLLSSKSTGKYSEKYLQGKPHIEDPEYKKIFNEKLNYNRIWEMSEKGYLYNKGQRTYDIGFCELKSGERFLTSYPLAKLWESRYPGELVAEKIEM